MEFILALIIFLIFFSSSSVGDHSTRNKDNSHRKYNVFRGYQDDCNSSDPAETFHLEDGLNHEVDCDGYCEECDDYHE